MSTSGYNGDSSSSNSPMAMWMLSSANNRRAPAVAAGPTPGTRNFLHGMHSFRSADELQFYLQRMGGPGSIVNVTDAFHYRNRELASSTNAMQGRNSGEIATLPPTLPALTSGGTAVDVSSTPPIPLQDIIRSYSAGNFRSSPSETPPVPAGYQRTTYLVGCEIHNPANTSTVPSTFDSLSPPDGVGTRGPGQNVIYIGYCAICQGLTIDHSRVRGNLALPQ